MKNPFRHRILAALLFVGCVVSAHAQTIAYTTWANINSAFEDPANWPGGVPDINYSGPDTFQIALLNSGTANVTTSTSALFLLVGSSGNTATLNIQNGGTLVANLVAFGEDNGSAGHGTVSGTGVLNASSINVGDQTSDFLGGTLPTAALSGSLAISGGGTVNSNVSIGYDSHATGTVTLADSDSSINGDISGGAGNVSFTGSGGAAINGSIYVGGAGTSTVTLDTGAMVTGNTFSLGSADGGTVTGLIDQATVTVEQLYVRGGADLTVQNGATIDMTSAGSSQPAQIGGDSGATGTMTLTGAGTTWTNGGGLIVGSDQYATGTGGTGILTVSAGASMSSGGDTYLGFQGADSDGTITVTGENSSWDGSGFKLNVGNQGTGHLNILDGGSVGSSSADIRASSGHTSTVLVDGTNSSWNVTGDLQVGSVGPGAASLTVSNGGTVNSGDGHISIGNTVGTVTVTDANSTWNVTNLTMAHNLSSTATLDISSGGLVANTGDAELGHLGTATVNVDGGTWTNTGNINFNGGVDTLTVAGGGTVTSTGINMGTLTGANSTLNIGAAANASAATPGTVYVDGGEIHAAGPTSTSTVVFNHTGNAGDNYTFNSTLSGHLSVVHQAGYTDLTGTNTYTEGTIINGGTLVSDGSLNGALGTGDVTVNSGGHLAGFDAVAGDTTVNSGGHLAPNLLRFDSSLTLNGGANLDFTLGNTAGIIVLNDGASLTGPTSGLLTINVFDDGFFAPNTYTLIDFHASGATSDLVLGDFIFGTVISGYDYSLAFNGNTLELTAVTSAIPEPATYAAVIGLAALGLAARRRWTVRVTQSL